MKIAFFFDGYRFVNGDGRISQALKWKEMLESRGHEVSLINPWEFYSLSSYDVVQIFGFTYNTANLVRNIYEQNQNIALSPILDPCHSKLMYKFYSHFLGCTGVRAISNYRALYEVRNLVKRVLVRSEWEKEHLIDCFSYKPSQCSIVHLSSNVEPVFPLPPKEDFCLHISILCDPRKNVKRIVEAAVKYKFRLVLAGSLRNEQERKMLNSWIEGHHNIEYRGFVTEEEKKDLYRKAKVFALPSTNEGVGLVALEAASYGSDVVITNIGGPKEYYANGKYAKVVDPMDTDQIGLSIMSFLDGDTFQPELAQYISANFSSLRLSEILESVYLEICRI